MVTSGSLVVIPSYDMKGVKRQVLNHAVSSPVVPEAARAGAACQANNPCNFIPSTTE